MPLEIIRNDIIHMKVDAIINPSNQALIQGHLSSVSGQIFKAAGEKELKQACDTLGSVDFGQAVITPGFKLPAKYIIHIAGPRWLGGSLNEVEWLAQSYRSALALALDYKLESIAFPLLSSGSYAFPKEDALKTAITVIQDFVLKHDVFVYLVVFDSDSFKLSTKLSHTIKKYIDDNYVQERDLLERSSFKENKISEVLKIDHFITELDDSFSTSLFKLIDQKKLDEVETYKKSNISKATFSKIRGNIHYQPSKSTAMAFCIGLQLNLNESRELLEKAGYSFSRSSRQDLIVRYFIERNKHNIFDVNEALFDEKQPLLGSNF